MAVYEAARPVLAAWAGKSRGVTLRSWQASWERFHVHQRAVRCIPQGQIEEHNAIQLDVVAIGFH